MESANKLREVGTAVRDLQPRVPSEDRSIQDYKDEASSLAV